MSEAVKEWACNTPGGQVRLADLTLETLAELEKKCGTEWHRIVARPRASASNAVHIYAACCTHVGCEPEQVTARKLLDVFELVDEDLPDMYQAGIPKAEGGASTSTSPGAPSTSSGPPPKSDS